ncbi:YwmB family TATA-box binding protein [Bacillus salitolerans]|uniref:YwmB family TATA-box binding protein n=1 Tax=Bacillus salitolerans TaxID=1437434 RepID=A0ABW4LKJ5_9BACI
MKTLFIRLCMLCICMSGVIGYKTIQASGEDLEVLEIVDELEGENVTISEWSLYTKEEVSSVIDEKSFTEKVTELQSKTSDFKWDFQHGPDRFKVVGTKVHDSAFQEKIILSTALTNNHYYTYLIYEAVGSGWKQNQSKEYFPVFTKTKADIFQDNPTNFSCVKGNFNDTIEGVLFDEAKGLLSKFDAELIEYLNEETFVSVTAYTEKWENVLPTMNGKMNVQIALRKLGLGDKTTFVVSTPIITSEY